jgi:L-alanine-DL-glutamate epimerase-like enolase superfamily enzyme
MKITKIETIWFEHLPANQWQELNPNSAQALPNNLWVRVYTDEGLTGLGETYYLPRAVSAIVHDFYAPLLIGRNPLDIENHWNNLFSAVIFSGSRARRCVPSRPSISPCGIWRESTAASRFTISWAAAIATGSPQRRRWKM